MARPNILTEEEIKIQLKQRPNWELQGNTIVRELHASNFTAAVGALNSIAILAETMDHHPDMLIYGWNKLRIVLTTHDRGNLTELDFKLAAKIDELNFGC